MTLIRLFPLINLSLIKRVFVCVGFHSGLWTWTGVCIRAHTHTCMRLPRQIRQTDEWVTGDKMPGRVSRRMWSSHHWPPEAERWKNLQLEMWRQVESITLPSLFEKPAIIKRSGKMRKGTFGIRVVPFHFSPPISMIRHILPLIFVFSDYLMQLKGENGETISFDCVRVCLCCYQNI